MSQTSTDSVYNYAEDPGAFNTATESTSVIPVVDPPPVFNPLDPTSIAFYIGAVLTVIGFVLHKDLSDYAGPVALGVTAAVGIAMGIINAIKYGSWNAAQVEYTGMHVAVQQEGLRAKVRELTDQVKTLSQNHPTRSTAPSRKRRDPNKPDGRTREGRAAKAAAAAAKSRRP